MLEKVSIDHHIKKVKQGAHRFRQARRFDDLHRFLRQTSMHESITTHRLYQQCKDIESSSELFDGSDEFSATYTFLQAIEEGQQACTESADITQVLGYQCGYALITGTINTYTKYVPTTLIPYFIKHKFWSFRQAVAHIHRIPDAYDRAAGLSQVLSLVDIDLPLNTCSLIRDIIIDLPTDALKAEVLQVWTIRLPFDPVFLETLLEIIFTLSNTSMRQYQSLTLAAFIQGLIKLLQLNRETYAYWDIIHRVFDHICFQIEQAYPFYNPLLKNTSPYKTIFPNKYTKSEAILDNPSRIPPHPDTPMPGVQIHKEISKHAYQKYLAQTKQTAFLAATHQHLALLAILYPVFISKRGGWEPVWEILQHISYWESTDTPWLDTLEPILLSMTKDQLYITVEFIDRHRTVLKSITHTLDLILYRLREYEAWNLESFLFNILANSQDWSTMTRLIGFLSHDLQEKYWRLMDGNLRTIPLNDLVIGYARLSPTATKALTLKHHITTQLRAMPRHKNNRDDYKGLESLCHIHENFPEWLQDELISFYVRAHLDELHGLFGTLCPEMHS